MKNNKWSLVGLALAILSFSSYEVVSKTVVGHIDATQLTFIRYLFGGLCLLPFALLDLRKRGQKMGGRDWLNVLLLGALNVAVSMNLIQIGYQFTNANLSAVIISANPIFVALFSALILKEMLSFKKMLGLTAGIAGVLIAMGGTGGMPHDRMWLGIGLQVAGMLAFSLYTVFGKKTAQKLGSSAMTAFTNMLGALAALPIVLAQGISPFAFDLAPIWGQMFYLCIINTGLAYYLYFKALESLDTSLGAMSFLVKPLLASLIAAVVLGESLTVQLFIGIALVSSGVYLVLLSTRRTAKKTVSPSSRVADEKGA